MLRIIGYASLLVKPTACIMKTMKKNLMGYGFLIIAALILIEIGSYFYEKNIKFNLNSPIVTNTKALTKDTPKDPKSAANSVQVSGWVAWWKEKEAYATIEKYHSNLSSISPVWFELNTKSKIDEVGTMDKAAIVSKLKSYGLKVIPTLGSSEIKSTELSTFLNDPIETNLFIDSLITRLTTLKVDGIDLDFEDIKLADKDKFTAFVTRLEQKTSKNNLTLSVTIHAKTGNNDWEGSLGQDTQQIGQLADEVRVMAYDYHTKDSGAGAITPTNWLQNVVKYSQQNIPKEKLVIGLPSYGYVWNKNGDFGDFQYDEFVNFTSKTKPTITRDTESGEQVYNDTAYVGWLSDATAISKKVTTVQTMGVNRIVIWNIGGMDNSFFSSL